MAGRKVRIERVPIHERAASLQQCCPLGLEAVALSRYDDPRYLAHVLLDNTSFPDSPRHTCWSGQSRPPRVWRGERSFQRRSSPAYASGGVAPARAPAYLWVHLGERGNHVVLREMGPQLSFLRPYGRLAHRCYSLPMGSGPTALRRSSDHCTALRTVFQLVAQKTLGMAAPRWSRPRRWRRGSLREGLDAQLGWLRMRMR
jgi:hypothetical protein